MMTRRGLLALAGVAALSGCGRGTGGTDTSRGELASRVQRVAATPTAATTGAVTAFTADLYGEIAAGAEAANIVCSPYSVAIALGMTVQGARGETQRQMLDVLHSEDAASLASGLNGIDAALARRPREVTVKGKRQRVDLAPANSLWVQADVAWRQEVLDVLAREFGAGLRTVDYRRRPEPARQAINAWVAERTRKRIPELIPDDVIDMDTRMTLVNALWFKAPWLTPFEKNRTRPAPFHRLDGSRVDADLMREAVPAGYVGGEGWEAAVLPYAGGELAMTVVVPDTGRFAEVERSVGTWLPRVLGTPAGEEQVDVGLPRWTSRTGARLDEALKRLGMPLALTPFADFSGLSAEESTFVGAVVHEGFVAVDEAGTEAAAATAVDMQIASAPPVPRHTVVADRPFLYAIHDLPTRTPLFVGRVLDPTR
jgi:serpin B